MTDSPFLPGTHIQYAWDSTSLGWLKTCPRLYQYSMIEGWRSRGESVHLKFGQLYHSALECYDKYCALEPERSHDDAVINTVWEALIGSWEKADDCPACKGSGFTGPETGYGGVCSECGGQKATGPGKPWSPDHPSKTRETLIRSIIWYLDHFKDDPAKTVVLANGKPAVELSFKMELEYGPEMQGPKCTHGPECHLDCEHPKLHSGESWNCPSCDKKRQPYVLCGHLDRVVEFTGGTYVMDRKTSSSTIGSAYFDQYSPDNQMSLYTMAAKVIYQTPVKGVIIDAVQIAVGFSRFSRGFTYRTDSEIEEWLGNTAQWLKLAESYAVAGFWPMNDKACHHYGGCTFRKVCSKSPEVRQKFLETDFVKNPWNPLEVR